MHRLIVIPIALLHTSEAHIKKSGCDVLKKWIKKVGVNVVKKCIMYFYTYIGFVLYTSNTLVCRVVNFVGAKVSQGIVNNIKFKIYSLNKIYYF